MKYEIAYRCAVGLLGGKAEVRVSNWLELLLIYGVRGCTGKAGV